ncbi:MAG: VCBS repeat-containing protein [Desulfosarcina sp.]|nr:VCBS repeat-containing protein [Desulfosarcina sp.]
MKTQSHKPRNLLMLFSFVLMCAITATPALAAPARVAILPFAINAEKDMTFLQEGIMDMLGSRLAWRDKVEVINKNETKAALATVEGIDGESRALLVGGKLQADFVLFGSLTVFGESVSIDARMVDVTGQQAPVPFFAQTRGMGEVIPQINQFASTINTTVFGREVVQRPAAVQAGTAPAAGVQPAAPLQDPRMHPEKLLQSGVQGESPAPGAGQSDAPNPAFVSTAAAGTAADTRNYWKSRNFRTLITGLGIADVDQDGQQEVVLVSEKLVSIYRMENQRLVKSSEIAETRTSTYLSVDVGDINSNGTPEIYINSLGPNRTTVDSFVMEYTGGEFKVISAGSNWYYRVAQTNDKGTLLLGQRQLMGDDSVFNGPIHEMNWQGDRIVPGTQLLTGGKANLMGLTYADITSTGQSAIIAYSDWDRIRVYSSGSEMIWEDGDRSGGNTAYFTLAKTDRGYQNQQFFPLRIRATDIDRNGKPEIMVARHDELARNMLKDFRSFSKARVESMQWDGLGLATQWKTQNFSGRVSDFAVGDLDNDGQDELVIAVVSKEGAVAFMDAVSSIIAFDLNVQ